MVFIIVQNLSKSPGISRSQIFLERWFISLIRVSAEESTSFLASRHSGRAPAVVTLGGSHAGGDWLTPNSESPELPLLLHTRQTLEWLGNMNLHSQREVVSSQPSGNLDMCLMFPQGTTVWASSGSETSLDSWDVFPPWCTKDIEIQRPWENYNHPYIL